MKHVGSVEDVLTVHILVGSFSSGGSGSPEQHTEPFMSRSKTRPADWKYDQKNAEDTTLWLSSKYWTKSSISFQWEQRSGSLSLYRVAPAVDGTTSFRTLWSLFLILFTETHQHSSWLPLVCKICKDVEPKRLFIYSWVGNIGETGNSRLDSVNDPPQNPESTSVPSHYRS